MSEIKEVIIIGSGPAGYTAAIYTARANLNPLMITGVIYGGQLVNTTDVENFPGFLDGITGPDLMKTLHYQSKKFGTSFIFDDVKNINISNIPYKVTTLSGDTFYTKSIIIATGAKAKWLHAEGESELRSNGISTCATCDGALFSGKKLLVIGGGDSAMEEANFLTRFASEVTIIHRRDVFKASSVMLKRAQDNPKIKWQINKKVLKWIVDNDTRELKSALLEDTLTQEQSHIDCEGVFIAIGHTPMTSFLPNEIKKDNEGYIVLDNNNTMTNIDGIFACGDVSDKIYKQAITAAGSGCKAAIDCDKWLKK